MINTIIQNFTNSVGVDFITLGFAGFFVMLIVWAFIDQFL
jgi:hypothetical protein